MCVDLDAEFKTVIASLKQILKVVMEPENDDCAGKYSNASDDTDPKYLIFLENVRKDGKSYLLKVGKQNGPPHLLKYEEEDVLPDESSLEKCDTQCGSRVKRKKSRKKSRTVSKRKKEEVTEDVRNMTEENYKLRTVTKRNLKKEVKEDVRNMTEEDYGYVLNSDIICSYDMVEEDYMSLLVGHQITEKGYLKFSYEGRWLIYEDDSDSDLCVIDPETFEKEEACNPFVPSKVFNANVEEDNNQHLGSPSGNSQSQFREKLLRDLQRPYDQTEYERLLDEISARKPIECNRDLRNGRDRVYSSSKNGKSYLDYYGDFQQKLKDAEEDKHKQLNLLRGFFFYLKNLTQVGSFKPWKDQSCLVAMPASSKKLQPV